MRIAMVASEANPLAKTGGLADVIYALSVALNKAGEDVIIVMPYYESIARKRGADFKLVTSYPVYLSWRKHTADIYTGVVDGINYYLIKDDYYFGRPNLYGYDDDAERFAFFSLAAEGIFGAIGFNPDIIHTHDWQPGMLPVLIKERHQNDPVFKDTKFVVTIHNPAFKGYFDRYFLNNYYGLSDDLYDCGNVRFEGQCSSLKAALVYSEKITTVSPTHARELLTASMSQGLCSVLQYRLDDFVGIVNGLDTNEFAPAKDPHIYKKFNRTNVTASKLANRKALFEEFNMHDDGTAPVYGLVSRLTYQKGIDLILSCAHDILGSGAKFAILGSGEKGLEEGFQRLKDEYPEQVLLYVGYSDPLAHKIYAASDFFLMPSLFEPCGIGQMIAQRYGALPIVRATGGLADTVEGYNGENLETATGFSFEEYSAWGLGWTCDWAQKTYADKAKMARLVDNVMSIDNSWTKSCKKYLKLYKEIVK